MSNALKSLFGDQNALAGNVGGQRRVQETWTPDWVIDAASQAMGGIQLDPCGASSYDSEVTVVHKRLNGERVTRVNPTTGGWFADITLTRPGAFEGLAQSPHGGTVISKDSYPEDWTQARSVYLNPEFAELEKWLTKAAETGRHTQVIALSPVRTHRSWWFPTIQRSGGAIVYLSYNVKFKGHDFAFPAPLCLISWNCTLPDLGARETWRNDK